LNQSWILKTNMNENKKSIGIFDSGLGGLTVLKELKLQLPNESFIYFGDIKNLPYGNKSNKSILNYSHKISDFLVSKNIKGLVIACNTASAIAYKKIDKLFQIPVYNVIDPCVEKAIQTTETNHIAVIGTEATINAGTYQKKINKIDKKVNIISRPCPLFVPIVEENLIKEKFTYDIVKYYLKTIKNSDIDTLILGCTHYPFINNLIGRFLENKIKIISSSIVTAQHIKKQLSKRLLLNQAKSHSEDSFYVSDEPQKFNYLAQTFLNNKKIKVKKIVL